MSYWEMEALDLPCTACLRLITMLREDYRPPRYVSKRNSERCFREIRARCCWGMKVE